MLKFINSAVLSCVIASFGLNATTNSELSFVTHEDEVSLYKAFISLHANIHSGQPKQGFKAYLTDKEKQQLLAKGFTVNQVNAAVSNASETFTIDDFVCYENLAQSKASLRQLTRDYPELTELITIGSSERQANTGLGHDLEVLKITANNTIEDKPKLFIHAAMHAREYATAPTVLAFIRHMLAGYGADSDITWILQQHELHVLLFMNPDGREKAEQGLDWRKNANDSYCTEDELLQGADLNRNFTYSWNKNATGGSIDECAITYKGPSQASEPETQAVEEYLRSIFEDRRGPEDDDKAPDDVAGMHIDVHSYGELVLWPWGHTESSAPNAVQLEQIGRKFAYFNDYRPQQAIGLYATSGTSESISYGELGIPQLTIELGTDFFQDCLTYEESIKDQNITALKYAARIVSAPYQLSMGPDVNSFEIHANEQPVLATDQLTTVVIDASTNNLKREEADESVPDTITSVRFAIDEKPSGTSEQIQDFELLTSSEVGKTRGWWRLSTKGLSLGRHQLFVQLQDEHENWGPIYSSFFDIAEVASTGSAPIADFTYKCSGLICNFYGENSLDLDDGVSEYKWLISLSQYEEIGANTSYTFRNAGTFPVKLIVTDGAGNQAQYQQWIQVKNTHNSPEINSTVKCNELVCEFSATKVAGETLEFSWMIDGHSYEDQSEVTHEFSQKGSYSWQVVANDEFGRQVEVSRSVEVATTSSLTLKPAIKCDYVECDFSLTDIDTRFVQYGWEINNESYNSQLSVTKEHHGSDINWHVFAETEANHKVAIEGEVMGSELSRNFGVTVSSNCEASTCEISINQLPSSFTQVNWNFEDGQTMSGEKVTKLFSQPGSYGFELVLEAAELSFSIAGEVVIETSEEDADGSSSEGGSISYWVLCILVLLTMKRRGDDLM